MSAQYDNANRGAIWKNEQRKTDAHPHFTGSLDVEGVQYWVSAWKRGPDASERAPALSFSVKRKDAKAAPVPAAPVADDPDDDIPF